MKNRRKILPRIILLAVVLVLITALAFANVYAKYVTNGSKDVNTRPAAFELVFDPSNEDGIEVNFARDGEPGAPIGYNEAYRKYDFSVRTSNSEVASNFILKITFNSKVALRIAQAREDKIADGLWCDYRVWMKNSSGEYEILKDLGPDNDCESTGTGETLIWTKTFTVEPGKNPNNSTGEDTMCDFRLEMVFYNNTMLPETDGNGSVTWPEYTVGSSPNAQDYFFSSDAIDIEVSSTQINPEYVGQHVYPKN